MASHVIDINSFRCTNHSPDRRALMVGRFDVDNPCSWCLNRSHVGPPASAFHYVEYGRWEFPFVAEANCRNFSLIQRGNGKGISPSVWKAARIIHEDRDRINKVGTQFAPEFSAYEAGRVPPIGDRIPRAATVTYPSYMNATDFFREVSDLRSEFFGLKHELLAAQKDFLGRTGIRDTNLDKWLEYHSQRLGGLTKLIDQIETTKRPSGLAVVAKFAVNTIAGGAAWDTLKWVGDVVGNVIRGK